jgi:hypothetical protein
MIKKAAPNNGDQSSAATEPLVATQAQDIAKFEAWLATKKGPVETAAYKKAKRRIANAWKSSELQTALHYVVTLKTTEPLAQFLESKTRMTRTDRIALGGFIRSLEARKSRRALSPRQVAEKNAVYLVQLGQLKWCKTHGRERVPRSVTEGLITDAVKTCLTAFKVQLDPDNIRRIIKKK